MATIEKALIPFVIMIIGINAMMMFMTTLPNSVDGSTTLVSHGKDEIRFLL